MRALFLNSLVAALVLACAPPSTTTGGHNSNVITREEISAAHVNDAYDAVATLRPFFLRYRGTTSLHPDTLCTTVGNSTNCKAAIPALENDTGYPRVYLNHQFYGPIASLRGIDAGGIVEIHYYNLQEAQYRFGLGNPNGAIEVVTGPVQ